jgi:hypothetical protein
VSEGDTVTFDVDDSADGLKLVETHEPAVA